MVLTEPHPNGASLEWQGHLLVGGSRPVDSGESSAMMHGALGLNGGVTLEKAEQSQVCRVKLTPTGC